MTTISEFAIWLGMAATLVAGLWTVVRYVLGELRKVELATERDLADLRERIERTRDETVRRDDLDRHIQRMEAGVGALRQDVRDLATNLSARVDALLVSLQRNGAAGV